MTEPTRDTMTPADEGEHCQDCGSTYSCMIWTAQDDLWMELVGHEGGLLCPGCFTARAQERGIRLRWVPHATRLPDSFIDPKALWRRLAIGERAEKAPRIGLYSDVGGPTWNDCLDHIRDMP